jgi:hypothetical protein
MNRHRRASVYGGLSIPRPTPHDLCAGLHSLCR